MHQESNAFLDALIQRAYEKCPSLASISPDCPMIEGVVDREQASNILRDTAIVEALNLKATILFNQGNKKSALAVA
jgi:phosphoribosylamine-glycine ligase